MIHLTLETFSPLQWIAVLICREASISIWPHPNWTGERAIAGVTSGLIGFGQQVTWEERHFGFKLHHTSRITEYDRPHHFQDCMVRGRFKSFCHDHYFESHNDGTVMRDEMEFTAPYGIIGNLFENALLKSHMKDLLLRRNKAIKQAAEGENWRALVESKS